MSSQVVLGALRPASLRRILMGGPAVVGQFGTVWCGCASRLHDERGEFEGVTASFKTVWNCQEVDLRSLGLRGTRLRVFSRNAVWNGAFKGDGLSMGRTLEVQSSNKAWGVAKWRKSRAVWNCSDVASQRSESGKATVREVLNKSRSVEL